MKSPDVSLIFYKKGEILWFSRIWKFIVKFSDFPWRWPTCIVHIIDKKKLIDQVKGKPYFQKI